jgi:hypothetical protein
MYKAMLLALPLLASAACVPDDGSEQQLARERQSCSQLGFAPDSDALAACAGNLHAAMFTVENPPYD